MADTPDTSRKKTRRRLRVSCVECTRRRQRCDRQQPCALCKSRGVEDLCRWELEPFARPAPARPPTAAAGAHVAPGNHRQQERSNHPVYQPAFTPHGPIPEPVESDIQLSSPLLGYQHMKNSPSPKSTDGEVKEAAIALAQLSTARRSEYLGTGTLICGLYNMNDSVNSRASSEQHTGTHTLTNGSSSPDASRSFSDAVRALVAGLPPKDVCDALIWSFFEGENWRYAIPKANFYLIYDDMWGILQSDPTGADGINVNWLTLLHAMFALASTASSSPSAGDTAYNIAGTPEDDRRGYFFHALSGRRLVEDMSFSSLYPTSIPPSVAECATYGCLAAVLLASYMRDRGSVNSAWKMVGSAIRTAQSIGLHRDQDDPKNNYVTNDERDLRRTTWSLLSIADRLLSSVLERPAPNRAYLNDVPLPKSISGSFAPDGTTDTNMMYHACMVQLSDIIAETGERCSSLNRNPYQSVIDMDNKFDAWERALPAPLASRSMDASFDNVYPMLPLQRWTLAIYHHAARMMLHRPFLQSRPPVLPAPRGWVELNPSRCKCIKFAKDLLHAERQFRTHAFLTRGNAQPAFENTFFVFNGAMTLCAALVQDPEDSLATEWREEIEAVVGLLEDDMAADVGDITRQALKVIAALRKVAQQRADGPSRLGSGQQGPGMAMSAIGGGGANGLSLMGAGSHGWTGKASVYSPSSPFEILGSTPPADEAEAAAERVMRGLAGGWTAFELLHSLDVEE